jgi:hypothetical protein
MLALWHRDAEGSRGATRARGRRHQHFDELHGTGSMEPARQENYPARRWRTYFERAFAAKFPSVTWKTRVTMSYEILLGIFACLCLLIGLGEVVGWVWHLFF